MFESCSQLKRTPLGQNWSNTQLDGVQEKGSGGREGASGAQRSMCMRLHVQAKCTYLNGALSRVFCRLRGTAIPDSSCMNMVIWHSEW
ncbi:Hypothetical protein NTJ_04583 [Nesidiocoris tenuis]|uniref:Uncharacterized protein n=1 Tax=Nesidiocoris tenuis TaxID=355587 RepID=A0ABN7AHP0_9HEMI|nr:Hypothetical protein NTJ_04583 [Nesidiocoris tenuis]